jgi:hypothetical protein
MKMTSKYEESLNRMPAKKQGRHTYLMTIGNYAALAGVPQDQALDDIRRVTSGDPMSDKEIADAVAKAFAGHGAHGMAYRPPPKPAPLISNGNAARQRIISAGTISEDVDLWELSPSRLLDHPAADMILLLKTHFKSNELIFIGDRYEIGVLGYNIRTAAAWIVFFATGGKAGPYIIVNPLNGIPTPKKSGDGDSLRGDGNVETFRHCLVEFDGLPREDQIRFWSGAKLPILALIDSGGKSIHAWLDIRKMFNVTNSDEWSQHVKIGLYEKVLVPLGVDRACCNPSRLSRLPGFFRSETGRFQRLLWLSPVGREVTR